MPYWRQISCTRSMYPRGGGNAPVDAPPHRLDDEAQHGFGAFLDDLGLQHIGVMMPRSASSFGDQARQDRRAARAPWGMACIIGREGACVSGS